MCGKMAEELLSLKWNNHQAHFVDILTFLREQEIFVDATLACGGKLYAAHKFVLSTCSDYFKQMFTRSPSKHPIVYMKDVTARDLEALLDFMYNGEVNVPQSSLGSLIKTAEGLQIKGLAVPDDPPAPKRERDREKERDHKVHLEHSPPAKRPRPRERSPPHPAPPSLPQTPSVPRTRSPPHPPTPSGASQVSMPPVEATLDEDSRTSVHSANSTFSENNSAPSLSSKQPNSGQGSSGDTTPHQDQLPSTNSAEEPSPGPSGIQNPHQSKQEPEVDIKQEDVVDLGEEDEGDWNLEGDGGGGGDASLGGSENPNFPEVMLPHADGSVPTSGDPAMGAMVQAKDILAFPPLQDIMGRIPEGDLSLRMRSIASAVDEGSRWGVLEGDTMHKDLYHGHSWTNSGSNGSGTNCGSNNISRAPRDHLDPESRPFPCPYCPFSFKRRYTLQEHVRIHIGFRPYACRSCGKTFTQRSSLIKHVRVRVCQKHAAHVA
ncbi:broad-complex core protein isoforms 1/2/3/4/5-like isoform X8 [Macrobrachium rosenbergii]|uniref:broad-complex core protein isoforms 1/2/3/4/5-like isoform X8 n=1 Tax=Macrobrachium rosenbergii TaxID=79674 RepID=UPI0034D3A5C9